MTTDKTTSLWTENEDIKVVMSFRSNSKGTSNQEIHYRLEVHGIAVTKVLGKDIQMLCDLCIPTMIRTVQVMEFFVTLYGNENWNLKKWNKKLIWKCCVDLCSVSRNHCAYDLLRTHKLRPLLVFNGRVLGHLQIS